MNDDLPPLPEPAHESAPNFGQPYAPFFTADQMRAYAAAARRSAKIVAPGRLVNDDLPPLPEEEIEAYWDAAFDEGRRVATHDTKDGKAQETCQALKDAIRVYTAAAVARERERCAKVCEELGEGLACDEVSTDECAAAIRKGE